jgi:hypothetical protein
LSQILLLDRVDHLVFDLMCGELNKYKYNFVICRLLVNISITLSYVDYWLKNEDDLEVQIRCGLLIWSGLSYILLENMLAFLFSFLLKKCYASSLLLKIKMSSQVHDVLVNLNMSTDYRFPK